LRLDNFRSGKLRRILDDVTEVIRLGTGDPFIGFHRLNIEGAGRKVNLRLISRGVDGNTTSGEEHTTGTVSKRGSANVIPKTGIVDIEGFRIDHTEGIRLATLEMDPTGLQETDRLRDRAGLERVVADSRFIVRGSGCSISLEGIREVVETERIDAVISSNPRIDGNQFGLFAAVCY